MAFTPTEWETELLKWWEENKIYQKPEKILTLKNHVEVSNISELYNALRLMDEATYRKHTAKGSSEIAQFAGGIDSTLGEKLQKSKTRTGSLRILEAFIEHHKEHN